MNDMNRMFKKTLGGNTIFSDFNDMIAWVGLLSLCERIDDNRKRFAGTHGVDLGG